METNYLIVISTAIIPLLIGFVWYHPSIFGTAWMKETGVNPEDKSGNMAVIFGLSILLSIMLSVFLPSIVIHQFGLFSMLMDEPGFQQNPSSHADYTMMMEKYGRNFRTFKHGFFHGIITSVFFALPVLGTNAIFEKRSFKYIFINLGYWVLSIALMGGIICQFA